MLCRYSNSNNRDRIKLLERCSYRLTHPTALIYKDKIQACRDRCPFHLDNQSHQCNSNLPQLSLRQSTRTKRRTNQSLKPLSSYRSTKNSNVRYLIIRKIKILINHSNVEIYDKFLIHGKLLERKLILCIEKH